MIAKITQEKIDKGLKVNSTRCPIALALEEVFNKTVYVGPDYFTFGRDLTPFKNKDKCWALPEVAIEFIKLFDSRKPDRPCEPFEFELYGTYND